MGRWRGQFLGRSQARLLPALRHDDVFPRDSAGIIGITSGSLDDPSVFKRGCTCDRLEAALDPARRRPAAI